MIVEDGTGLADSDSYVDPTDAAAVAYMANHLYAAEWTSASAGDKNRAVIMATRLLDATFDWRGSFVNNEQSLGWPRAVPYVADRQSVPSDSVPRMVWQATLETALALIQSNRTTDTEAGTQEVKRIGLGEGALDITLGDDPAAAAAPSFVPSYVRAMLRHLGTYASGGGMVKLYRA